MFENLLRNHALKAWVLSSIAIGTFLFLNHSSGEHSGVADLTVVHLTDPHLDTGGTVTDTPWTHRVRLKGYGLHRPCTGRSFEYLAQAVSRINNTIKPDVVVVTGDVVNHGDDVEAMRIGASLLRQLRCEVIVVQGDHDIVRKAEHQACWNELFGALHGCVRIKDFPFFFLPFDKERGCVTQLSQSMADGHDRGGIRFVALHRMLWAPRLMDFLARKFHGCSLLDPERELIVQALEKAGERTKVIVLCGHSHTDHSFKRGNITQFCTPALAEHPHAFRVIRIQGERVVSRLVRLEQRQTR